MSTISTDHGTEIYYKDSGEGGTIMLSHGCTLTADPGTPHVLTATTRLNLTPTSLDSSGAERVAT
ncbi:hypothetical protein IWX78_002986 [Mycetocola sp. CAN_C7]